jgi:hypothetical protein
MNAKEIVNQVKTLLGMEVKLATMKLSDGVTVLEAEMFEAGAEVFVLAEDQKIALPVGEYELEDGKILVVQQEGVIAEIKEAEVKEEMPEVEAEPQVEIEVEAEAEVAPTAKKTVESIIKETFFAEMEKLKAENEELKSKLETLSATTPKEVTAEVTEETTATTTTEVELEEVKPITFNPERTNEVEGFKFASKRPRSTMDAILEKLNK